MGHHAVQNFFVAVAVVGDASEAAMAQKAFKASIKRPADVCFARIVRTQELPCKGFHIGVGHLELDFLPPLLPARFFWAWFPPLPLPLLRWL